MQSRRCHRMERSAVWSASWTRCASNARHAAGKVATTSRASSRNSRPGYRLSDWLHARTADCPQKNHAGVTRACGAVMPDLLELPQGLVASSILGSECDGLPLIQPARPTRRRLRRRIPPTEIFKYISWLRGRRDYRGFKEKVVETRKAPLSRLNRAHTASRSMSCFQRRRRRSINSLMTNGLTAFVVVRFVLREQIGTLLFRR
jgi:hypothetical protein